jgi:phenylacetate-CoA ligase
MFAVPREQVVRIHASSGTTGKPTVVGYTRNDIETWATVMARSIRAAGARAGDILHVAYGYGLFTGGLGAHYGAEKLGCTVIPMSGGQTEKQVQLIQDFKPSVIMVTPSYMLAIAEEMERQGIDPKTSSLEIGIFGAEPWTPTMRAAIEAKLAMDAIDIYGLSEVIGPGVAQECIETKDGLTVWEDHFYPEIIDPATGRGAARRRERASSCSRRSPRRRCRSFAIGRATVTASCRPRHAPCAGSGRSPAAPRHDDHPRRQRVSRRRSRS